MALAAAEVGTELDRTVTTGLLAVGVEAQLTMTVESKT